LRADGVIGIVLSGGPSSVFSASAPIPDPGIFEIGVPVLGICYGLQLMGHMLGGKVASGERREYGHGTLMCTAADGCSRACRGSFASGIRTATS
jgi:GMP synthase (glutamine-hydrolysing)